jgi:hypothetical protein
MFTTLACVLACLVVGTDAGHQSHHNHNHDDYYGDDDYYDDNEWGLISGIWVMLLLAISAIACVYICIVPSCYSSNAYAVPTTNPAHSEQI